jgi:rubrerythrin
MSILDQAIEFEKKGRLFYMEKAAKAQNPAIRNILINLAEDEEKHAEFLQQIKDGVAKEFVPSNSMKNIRKILEESVLANENFLSEETLIQDVLAAAIDLEKRAVAHYTKEAIAAESEETQALLLELAKEEEKHDHLLTNLLKYIDQPKNILETQEFQHYDK